MNSLYNLSSFKKRVKFLQKSQYWSEKKISSYQLSQLKKIFNHVKKNVPFYNEFFKKKNIRIEKLEDLRKFPIIDKKIIQKDYNQFLVKGVNKKKLIHRTTGGSTATPLTVWSDMNFQIKDKANTIHYMSVFNLNIFKDKSVRLYGDKIPKKLIEKKIYWKKEKNKLIMSCYHINRKTFRTYIKVLKNFKPKYIHTRASAIFPLAKYISEDNLNVNLNIKYIINDGEYLTLGQRTLIENSFNSKLINIYGHTEGALVGYPCNKTKKLHIMPQNGIIEILDKRGKKISKDGKKGEIVATGFNNYIFPLIRYKTGDIGVKSKNYCLCKRNYPMLAEVEGRIQDYIIDKKKNKIPLAPAIFNYNDMSWKGVQEFKILQKKIGIITVLLKLEQKTATEKKKLSKYIKLKIGQLLGKNFNVKTNVVEKLKKSKIGKYRYLDQKLKLNL